MKDISKELLPPGEIGQLDGVEYKAVARNPNTCEKCEFDGAINANTCWRVKCGLAKGVYFVKV